MSSIFIAGDTHSTISFKKIKQFKHDFKDKKLTKKDVLIIAGDFGFLWHHTRTNEERYWLKYLDYCPWSTCFVDGNHENFDVLDNLQKTEMYGNKVGIVGHSIFHLLRGNVYKINKRRILAIGGANSHDREYRQWGTSMWKQEVITDADIDNALKNLKTVNNKVDLVISHCAPSKWAMQIIPLSLASEWSQDQSEEQLQRLLDTGFEFQKWFFGHYHEDGTDSYNDKWVALFDEIIEVIC